MNDSRLRKIYKEKAGRDWDEEGPYSSMSETEFIETTKELIKERDELIKSGINYMTEAHLKFTPNVTNSLALDWIEKAKKLVGEK